MEISDAIKYYIEENGLEKVPNPQFYSFLSDTCKEEVMPYRFILRFPDFHKMVSDLLQTKGQSNDIKQIAYKWSQITGFREDLIEKLLKKLTSGIQKFLKNETQAEKSQSLIDRYRRFHLKVQNQDNPKEQISNDIPINCWSKEENNKKGKENVENKRLKIEEIRKESIRQKEREDAIKEADEIRFNLEQNAELGIFSFSILLIVCIILLYLSYFLISSIIKGIFFSINPNLIELYNDHEIFGQGLMIAIVTLIVVYIPFPIYKRIWKRWGNFRVRKEIENWKKRNPNHRAAPYL